MLTRALVSPTLVGRDEELRRLVDLRLAAARGHGALVLVSGDAGIGKTRLLQSFRATFRGGRAALGIGLCREFGNRPYGPIQEALRQLDIGLAPEPATTREEQLARYVECVAAACNRQHVVLLIEDIHWADDGSLLFLLQLLPAIASLRLFVVATYRSDEACRLPGLEAYLARLVRDRSTHRIPLAPLSGEQLHRMLKLAAGPRTLSAYQVDEIAERSDGNPLFAEELLKNLLEGGTKELPLTVRATVLERVAGLDPPSRDVLSLASVLGRRFDAQFLADVCGLRLDDLLAVIRRLRNLQLIDEIDGEPLTYTFRHALTREAVYGDLLTVQARALHARILSICEGRRAEDYNDLGYHAWAAGDARAVPYNERAGDNAQALHAYADAVQSFVRALEFARDPSERARLFVKAAQSASSDGKSARAVDLYASAIVAFRDAGERDRVAQIYQDMSAQARIGGDSERAIQILEDALRSVSDKTSPDAAAIGLGLAHLWLDRGDVKAAGRVIASSAAAVDTLPYAKVVPYAALVAGDVAAWEAASRRLLLASHDFGAEQTASARFNRAFGLAIFGFDNEAANQFQSLLPEVRALRLSSLEVLACANLALIHARAGRLAEGRQLLERAGAIPVPSTTGPVALAAAALTIGYDLWDDTLVERFCSEAIVEAAFRSRINSTLGRIAGPYARWLHAHGERDRARAVLRTAMTILTVACGATESFLAAAELGDAATQAQAFERIALLDGMLGVRVYQATAAHLRALQCLREDRADLATAFAIAALEEYRELGWVLHEARCQELLGDQEPAATQYGRFGARGWARAPQPSANGANGGRLAGILSDREREVASLVANGTINKQIAELLSINQRTVEKYLTSIYGKLGLRNRSELAAFLTRSS